MADKDARDDDASFVEIIKEYPAIYDRSSKDLKDTNQEVEQLESNIRGTSRVN